MAPHLSTLQQRVRARKDTSDDEVLSDTDVSESGRPIDTSGSEPDESESEAVSGVEIDPDLRSQSSSSSPPADDPATLSFGALARAQETLGKRKRSTDDSTVLPSIKRARDSESSRPLGRSLKESSHSARTSKHAPQELTSKRAVTRHRSVIDAPKVTPRDPRFDPLTGSLDDNRLKQNYGFLSDYRVSEISQLKAAMRASKSAEEKEKLQKALRRMESRKQADDTKERAQKVIREHRKEEKGKVKEGKKPYYLKEGEINKRAQEERFKGMSEKKKERIEGRRTKKQAGKEKKMMPERRT